MINHKRLATIFFFLCISLLTFGQTTDFESDSIRSRQLYSTGVRLGMAGFSSQAIDTFQLALEIRKKIYGKNHYELGRIYQALGINYKNIGQNALAIENYKRAENSFSLKENNQRRIAVLYYNIANIFRAQLNYSEAIQYFTQAIEILQNLEEDYSDDIADFNYGIAEVLILMQNYKESMKIITENYENANDELKIYYSELEALVFQAEEKKSKANASFSKMIELAEDYYDENDLYLAEFYMSYAEFLAEESEFIKGKKMLDLAYKIIRQNESSKGTELAAYYGFYGDLFVSKPIATENIAAFKKQKQENLFIALGWYDSGLNALYKSESIVEIDSISTNNTLSFINSLNLLKSIADVYFEISQLDNEEKGTAYKESLLNALNYYKVINQLVQQARKEISNDESKRDLAELENENIEQSIATAYLAYELTQETEYYEMAFLSSEQSKSSSVFDQISNELAQENSLIPDSLLELEQLLNTTISNLNELLYDERSYEDADTAIIKQYRAEIFEASRERENLNRFLEEEYSDYYDLKYNTSMLGIKDIQKKMNPEEVILDYVISNSGYEYEKSKGDSSSYLYTFCISKNKSSFTRQKLQTQSKEALRKVHGFMSDAGYMFTQNDDSKDFSVSSHHLYKLLIEPYKEDIANKNLVIIPGGELNYLAFDALLTKLPDTSQMIQFNKLDYLIRDYNIAYANSVNILFKSRNPRKKLKNKILAFAPEYNSERFELSNASYTLLPLPGVQKEVDEIVKTTRAKVYRGPEATETRFREISGDYDVLHLAMHAYINDSLPAFSRLAFAPQEQNAELTEDGWLNTADIYNLDLNARLAVLSACNTGTGRLQKGEGVLSLARGFLFAGCPSIIMSLWEVEDESGTKIMSEFYKNLKRGKSKDEALRLAKLTYLENSNSRLAHPHYWMSFKCIGDNSSIYTSYDIYFFALLIVLILAFTIDQSIRLKRNRKQKQA